MKKLLSLFLLLALVLTACGTDRPNNETAPNTSAETVPHEDVSTGTIPLGTSPEIAIDPEERCAITANGQMAETVAGYYVLRSGYLFYADKSDLTNWVLVCNKPDCKHGQSSCNGAVGYCFWREDENNYYVNGSFEGVTLDAESVIGVAPDGSSSWIACSDGSLPTVGKVASYLVSQDGYYVCTAVMLEDGTWDCIVSRLKGEQFVNLFVENYPVTTNVSCFATATNIGIAAQGDIILTSQIPLDGTPDEDRDGWDTRPYSSFYQVTEDTIRKIPLTKEELFGAFLYKDHLCFYRVNDGFYYMDLSTGQEVKIADAAYENAYGHCVDGQYMIETTLGIPYYSSAATEPRMRYFDGETWHELELPEYWNTGYALRVLAGTSDRIFFTVDDDAESYSDRQQELCCLVFGEDSFTVCDKYPCSLAFD